ncbi:MULTISPECIES: hypothetical protein [unclassified Streptomyces]|uniref:hypothetical protein n=1 Tax=unclassified Streptomyces TaxID=2593676 RepID=UPI002DD97456|nr:hypothetical protein [Streptomyces sp. NBC_01766]WSC24946.1 hypothetical protein OIE60_35370 [Streptomyces sp. NBC_01766]
MTDTTYTRHDPPIEPTTVELSGERTDSVPPPASPTGPSVDGADWFGLPPRRTPPTPPPVGPPAVPPPPPVSGGGMAAVVPPGAPVTYVTNHYYPDAPMGSAPARFTLSRLNPAWNGAALVVGLLLVPVTGKLLHALGDEPGVIMAALAAAGLLELRRRGRSWVARVLTCNVVASSFVTPAGLYVYGYLVTGAWR